MGDSSDIEEKAVEITPVRYTSNKTSLLSEGAELEGTWRAVPNAAKDRGVSSSTMPTDEGGCSKETAPPSYVESKSVSTT